MTDTAEKADLILPSSFTVESDGSFTNTQKIIQTFEQGLKAKVGQTTLEQLINLNKVFGLSSLSDAQDVMKEIVSLLPVKEGSDTYYFEPTEIDNQNKLFAFGADSLTKMWIVEFDKQFE